MNNELVEVLTKVYAYVNQIKVCLALGDIAGVWCYVNALNKYIVSVDVGSPTQHALDGGESAPKKAESTPEVLSTSQALPKLTRRK
jgi:hypothetical protein